MSKFNPNDFSFEVSIPSVILFNEKIEPACIKLFAIIKGLTKAHGYCYATNEYLSECMDSCETSIKKWLRLLKQEGFIEILSEKRGIHWQRHIYLGVKLNKFLRRSPECPPGVATATGGEAPPRLHINKYTIRDIETNTPPPTSVCVFQSFGKYVKLEEKELKTLIDKHGEPLVMSIIDKINDYIASKGKPYKDYAATIRNWIRNAQEKDKIIPKPEKDLNQELLNKLKSKCAAWFQNGEMREHPQGIEFVKGQFYLLIKFTDFGFRDQLLNQLRKMGIDTGGI